MVVRAVRARRGLLHHSSAAALAAKLNGCGAGSGVTNTKQIELAIKDQDKRLATLTEQAGKDTGLTWEMVGADYIFRRGALLQEPGEGFCGAGVGVHTRFAAGGGPGDEAGRAAGEPPRRGGGGGV